MTDPQQLAIQERNTNVLVSASAGAGKTYLLIERLAQRIVQDHISLDQILAVTFTKAAASEMKNRLAMKLNRLRQTEIQERHWIDQQLAILSKAEISTIDSFCLNLIKQYYSMIGLNPTRLHQTLSNGQEKELKHLAFETALSHFYQQNPKKALKLSNHFDLKPLSCSYLEKSVHQINETAKSSSNYTDWMKHALSFYPKQACFSDYPKEMQDYFFSYWSRQLFSIQTILKQMKICLMSEKPNKTTEKITSLLSLITSYQKELATAHYEVAVFMIKQLAHYQFRVNKNEEMRHLNKQFTEIRNALEDSLIEESRLIKESSYLHEIAQSLLFLCQETEFQYQQLKEKVMGLDFNDMALFSLEILEKNNGYLAKKLQQKYAEIMVDEFQDTSELQHKILTMISNGKNLFRVGDLKQSIYGFRNAKPELMADLMKSKKDKVYHLEHNYRSKDHIVQFTNALFQCLMNYEKSSVPYASEDIVTIGKPEQQDKESSCVNLIQINSKDNMLGAKWIGQEILRLLEEGYTFQDICILTPSHADKAQLRRAFDEIHIPYAIDEKQGFFKSSVVQTIISFVHYFCGKQEDIHLFAVLQSPIFQISDEQFAKSRLSYQQEKPNTRFSTYFLDIHPTIKKRLEALKTCFLQEGTLAFLQALSLENSFYAHLSSQQKTNFDFLFEKIVQENIFTAYDFFHWLERSEDESSTESNSHLAEENLVKVETIHHSKGLQYKVVFLYKCDMKSQNNGPVEVSGQYGIGLDYQEYTYYSYHSSLVKWLIQQDNHRKEGEEFLRLAYVAITRAEEKLYLVSPSNKKEGSLTRDFILSNQDLGVLVQAALKDLPASLYHCIEVEELENVQEYKMQPDYPFVQELPHYSKDFSSIFKQDSPSHHGIELKPLNFEKKKVTGQNFGSKVHTCLEKLPNRPIQLDEIDPQLPMATRESILFFQNSDWTQKIFQTMDIHRELPYYYEENGIAYQGILDFIATNQKKAIILDYKTDHLDTEASFIARYQDQLCQYRTTFEKIYPEIETWIYSLHLKRFIFVKKQSQ